MSDEPVPAEAIEAAQAYDLAHRPPRRNWGRVPDEQVGRLLRGAAAHLAGIPPETAGRPVLVLAIGYDLGAGDAERIQRVVAAALRDSG